MSRAPGGAFYAAVNVILSAVCGLVSEYFLAEEVVLSRRVRSRRRPFAADSYLGQATLHLRMAISAASPGGLLRRRTPIVRRLGQVANEFFAATQ